MSTRRRRRGAAWDHEPACDDDADEGVPEAEEPLEEGARRPSRSEKRRVGEAAFDLGKALVELAPQKLEKLPLPEDIGDAVREARRIRSHAAKKRQMQYLARLLRQSDEVDAIREGYERLRDLDRKGTLEFQRLERWRARLIEEGEAALDELCERHPSADRERLRALVEETRREAAQGRAPRAFRALFRELKELAAGDRGE